MKEKPLLLEKSLDFLVQEMANRLDIKTRNKTFSEGYSPLIEDICFNNSISLLSIAKARGIDQTFIEIILHHVQTPFELTVMCILMLSKKLRARFAQPEDEKEKLSSYLSSLLSIYKGKAISIIVKVFMR